MVKKLKSKVKKLKLFQTKLTVFFFGLLGLFAIIFIAYFLYFQIAERKNIEDLLPNENLVLFTEFQKKEFPEIISNHPYFQQVFLESNLQKYLNRSIKQFQIQTSDWLGDKIGFSLYQDKLNNDQFYYYLFLESQDDKKALDFLRTLGLQGEELITEDYQNFKIISFTQSLDVDCSFIYGYFVCSNVKTNLQKLIDNTKDGLGLLSASPSYQKVKNNLPQSSLGKIYLNFENTDFKNLEFYLGPLKDYLKQIGVSFNEIKDGIKLNSYLSFSKGLTGTGTTLQENDLKNFIYGKDLALYLDGENLTTSIQQVFKVWDEVTPNFSIIIESVLRGYIKQFFEGEITLENEFYPLLKNQYALGIYLDPLSFLPQISLVLKTTSSDESEAILQKLYTGFYQRAGQYVPKEEETILPDGTVVKELVADESKVKQGKEKYKDVDIYFIRIEGLPYDFAYAIYEDKIFIATTIEFLKSNLDLNFNQTDSFGKSKIFSDLQKSRNLTGNEFSFMNLKQIKPILDLLNQNNQYLELISIFDYAIFSTKWFDDGMANEVILTQDNTL